MHVSRLSLTHIQSHGNKNTQDTHIKTWSHKHTTVSQTHIKDIISLLHTHTVTQTNIETKASHLPPYTHTHGATNTPRHDH